MGFQISTTRRFSAAHWLRFADGSAESIHGHNWRVRVTVASDGLDAAGLVMDFHELERLVDALIAPWHNRCLNDAEELSGRNPSAEMVAQVIAERLRLPEGVRLSSVEVWETDDNRAVYLPAGTVDGRHQPSNAD
ncbi:MAG: 6-carboxytetrahydropterin synthase [Phycisphaerae bacterium]|nr:6-carboxytetrahydropterin synthase [Phycisphaerae bacterium]